MAVLTTTLAASILVSVPLMANNIIQNNIGVNCSSVCVGNECHNTCSDDRPSSDITGMGIKGSGKTKTADYDVDGFNGVEARDGFEVEVVRGKQYKVTISADDNVSDRLVVDRENGALVLGLKQGSYQNVTLKARVEMPELEEVSARDTSKVRFSGFHGEKLKVRADGVSELYGSSNRMSSVVIDGVGNSHVDLSGSEIDRGELSVSGVSDVTVNFGSKPGSLTGTVEGVSSIRYCGELDSNAIEVSGVASVEAAGNCQ